MKFPHINNPKLTGRTIYLMGNLGSWPGQVTFYCGPEENCGALSDHIDVDQDFLESLFPDFDIEVSAAENYHIIRLTPDQDEATVSKIVAQRLESAGAVKIVV